MMIDDLDALTEYLESCKAKPEPPPGACAACGSTEGVQLEDSRTAYDTRPLVWDRFARILHEHFPEPDPNAPILLCRGCAVDHHAYWDERWNELNMSRL